MKLWINIWGKLSRSSIHMGDQLLAAHQMELDLALKDYWDGNFSCGVHDQVILISNHRYMITRVNKAKDAGWVVSQSAIDNAEELLAQWTANTKIVGHDYSKGVLDHQQMVAHARSGLI